MGQGQWHTVGRGDSAENLGAQDFTPVDDVWKAPENADLKKERQDPHLLAPGDRVYVPFLVVTLKLPTNERHKVVLKSLRTKLQLKIATEGKGVAGQAFILSAGGQEVTGSTGADGILESALPANVEARATLKLGQGAKARHLELTLRALGPIKSRAGWCARLHNLGYDTGDAMDPDDPRPQAALCAFQADHELDATAELDDKTKAKLKEVYGC
jgi:hypothetical protein